YADALRYQYKIGGKDWTTTAQHFARYHELPSGMGQFLVRAVNSDGIPGPSAVVSFRVLRPLWQRWWFLTLASTVVGLTVLAFLYRYRTARLIELERIRTRIATDLHDDIGSSLSQMAILSEIAHRQVEANGITSQQLSAIAGISRELVDSMSDIV